MSKQYTELVYSAKPDLLSRPYGYGFVIGGKANNRIVGHRGSFEGVSANLDIYLDQSYVSIVMSNYGGGSPPIENKIRELIALID